MPVQTQPAACVQTPAHHPVRDFRNVPIHMIGIGGSGMSGLAAMLLHQGARISGSDRSASSLLEKLARRGARIFGAHLPENLPPETALVVASAAIPDDHPEVAEARRRGVEVLKYARMLGLMMAQREGIAISGTHGKSTTTAWLAHLLRRACLDPSFVVGAVSDQLGGGSGVGDGRFFVAEACEFDRSFLNLRPRIAAILNIEEDHLDCYSNISAIVDAFRDFAALVPEDGLLVLNGQDPRCRLIPPQLVAPVETFGFAPGSTWQAHDLTEREGFYSCSITCCEEMVGRVTLGVPGRHNVLNALAVIAIARRCGVPWEVVERELPGFHGVGRRLELRAFLDGVWLVDDYAHHPTEIRVTLQAARERYQPRRLWCVFQPHQHSRTRFLLEDFARSFALADRVVVPEIYFVRDSEQEREAVSASDLVERIRTSGGNAVHIPDFAGILEHLTREVRPGDLVLTMGAGDIWKVADGLVERLREHLPS